MAIGSFKIVGWDHLEDMAKSHIKAHFRRDPKTGKMIFIKDYDDKKHKHLVDHTVKKGQKMVVDNPKSKHHGKEVEIKGYSDKYDTVYAKVGGQGHSGDFAPHHLKLVTSSSSAAADPKNVVPVANGPQKGPAGPVGASGGKALGIDDAKRILGLLGVSFTSPDMQHEKMRVESMTESGLRARIPKIKTDQKLYNFMRALNEWGTADKRKVADEIEKHLIDTAKLVSTAGATTLASQKAAPASPAATTPGWNKGDQIKVTDPKSKHVGKTGTVSSFSDKYGVVRVTLSDGTYTDFAPNRIAKEGTVAPAEPKEEVKAPAKPKAEKAPAPEPEKKVDLPSLHGNRNRAWESAPDEYKNIGAALGMLPLDDQAAEYLKKNIKMLQGQAKKAGSGYAIPQWAQARDESLFSDYWNSPLDGFHKDSKSIKNSPISYLIASKEDWEKAGYDYDSDAAKDLNEMKAAMNRCSKRLEALGSYRAMNEVVNRLIMFFMNQTVDNGRSSRFIENAKKKHWGLDTRLKDIVSDDYFENSSHFSNPGRIVEYFQAIAGMDSESSGVGVQALTVRDFFKGLHSIKVSAKKPEDLGGLFDSLTAVFPDIEIKPDRWYLMKFISNLETIPESGLAKLRTANEPLDLKFGTRWEDYSLPPVHYSAGELHKDVQTIERRNPILYKLSCANNIICEGSRQLGKKYNGGVILHKQLMESSMPSGEIAMRIVRKKKGTLEERIQDVSSTYIKEATKTKAKTKTHTHSSKRPVPAGLGCTFRSVDSKTEALVKKKIAGSWDLKEHGGFYHKIHAIYQISGTDHFKKYKEIEKAKDNVMFGYHSTAFSYATAISKSQYRASSGGMLGSGVYITDVSSKSAQYLKGDCNVCRHHGTRGVMLVNKVSLGKVHDAATNARNSGKHEEPSRGLADSIYAKKGSSVPGYWQAVRNDEHVVKNKDAVIPMYWVDIELTPPKK